MQKGFATRLPLRGAIAFGDYLEDTGRNIFLSPEFSSLAHAERDQDWSGCVVLPQAANRIIPVVFPGEQDAAAPDEHRAMVLSHFDVPSKSSKPSSLQWCLNWVYFLNPTDLAGGLQFLKSAKRENTLKFIDFIRRLPDEDRPLPEGFAPAVRILAQYTLGGVTLKFVDSSGNGVELPGSAPRLKLRLEIGGKTIAFPGPPRYRP